MPMDRLMAYDDDRSRFQRGAKQRRHWPDTVFRILLVAWLIFGLTSVLRALIVGQPSVAMVLLVAWGVIVIFVLWLRMGPPRGSDGSDLLR